MAANSIKLFHNQNRLIQYFPQDRKLKIHWFGTITEDEQDKNIEFLQELVKIYDIDHIEVHARKAKFNSLKHTRLFIEMVLKKIYEQGGRTLTIFQRPIQNMLFVFNAYVNALNELGIRMNFKIITN